MIYEEYLRLMKTKDYELVVVPEPEPVTADNEIAETATKITTNETA